MLRHSTKFIISNQRLLHLSRILNQVETKAVSEKSGKYAIQEKIISVSNTALSRYNEIIGFTEIDLAYQKVTALQVKSF
jgi:SpoU rRNA methylase family enzyme